MTLARRALSTRLLLVTGVFVLLALPALGVALGYGLQKALTSSFDQRLNTLANVIGASTQTNPDGGLTLGRGLGDPRFERVFSGWYWQITDADGGIRLTSRSLWDETLPVPTGPAALGSPRTVEGPRSERLRVVYRQVRIGGVSEPLAIGVAAPMDELDQPVAAFWWLTGLAVTGLGVLLLVLVGVQVRWGLAPLRRLRDALQAAEAGDRVTLPEDLPPELARVSHAMNDVLERDRRLIERGRAAAGNLAHALKTPLAVLKAQSGQLPAPHDRIVSDEIQRIDTAVRHHLARASAAGSPAVAERVEIGPVVRPVLDALAGMAERRQVELQVRVDDALRVRVDPQDLQEMVGNLVENAVRWAEQRVVLTIGREGDRFHLQLDDDGPGMTAEQRREALERGRRLDQSQPGGSGLGLDIVRDLTDLYHGALALETSQASGLRVQLTLPV